MPENSQATARPRGRRRPIRYDFRRQKTNALSVEPRRALAVYRALNLADNRTESHALLNFSGRESVSPRGKLVVSPADCAALARRLRDNGYPLDDDGIRRFKMERGFSNVVRIGPEVAAAYGRYARGKDARLNVSAEEWRELAVEMRRALAILMLIGRSPDDLAAVRRVLGVRDSHRAPSGVQLVGKVTAERLVRWARAHGWSLDDEGAVRIAKAYGLQDAGVDSDFSACVADAMLCRGEPVHDYTQFARDQRIVNRRTLVMLQHAEKRLQGAVRLDVLNGSYAGDVKGAHPHTGGGAVDLTLSSREPERIERAVLALRESGFAAWYRPRGKHPHVHAVAIGDVEASASALWQVKSFFEGRDGRSRGARDPHRDLDARLPRWVGKYRVAFV